jgi:hypothetical protein
VVPDVRRRLRLAAARGDVSVQQYVVEAIEDRLREDLGSTLGRIRCSRRCGTTARTRPMIACARGDVVLIGFVFSDESGT